MGLDRYKFKRGPTAHEMALRHLRRLFGECIRKAILRAVLVVSFSLLADRLSSDHKNLNELLMSMIEAFAEVSEK